MPARERVFRYWIDGKGFYSLDMAANFLGRNRAYVQLRFSKMGNKVTREQMDNFEARKPPSAETLKNKLRQMQVGRPPAVKVSKFDSYELKPIELPPTMGEEDMRPYRALAAAVLLNAAKALHGTSPRTKQNYHDASENARNRDSALRLLSGQDRESLDLWCDLVGMSAPEMIKAIRRDRETIEKRVRSMSLSTGRGRRVISTPMEEMA